MGYRENFANVGCKLPHILLPNEKIDMEKFACIAADQFSHDKNYWEEIDRFVAESPSSYRMMFPEAHMPITETDINNINDTMSKYLTDGTLTDIGESLIYIKRETSTGIRHGLMIALDLDQYDSEKNSKSMIRPTEGTVKDRLPIRVDIRKNAKLDMPHVMVLINDKKNLLMNYLSNVSTSGKIVYNFNLMMGGGKITGYKISSDDELDEISNILLNLKNEAKDNLLYAIGDGNHSLAAAKICYESDKSEDKRYALVELVNIYDDALKFYPIHRLLMNIDRDDFIKKTGIDLSSELDLQIVQKKIDEYILNHKEVVIEYMHDKNECIKEGQKENNLSIVFPDFSKDGFFENIIKYGTLCRKTFSMGEARDKRYYLETMKI